MATNELSTYETDCLDLVMHDGLLVPRHCYQVGTVTISCGATLATMQARYPSEIVYQVV